jgi:histone H3/H4
MMMNVLPLRNEDSRPIIPHEKFKKIFNSVYRDLALIMPYTIEDEAFHLLHNIFERYAVMLCKNILRNSIKHNAYVQPFHAQFVKSIYNEFDPVALPSNPLAKIQNKSNFENMITSVLSQVHGPDMQFSQDAIHQLNNLLNALAKELVDVSIYTSSNINNMSSGFRAIQAATGLVLPGELSKHAQSDGRKFTKDNKLKLSGEFDGKIDRINALNRESVVYLRAVIEYITAELCELSGNSAKILKSSKIETKHIKQAVLGDEELFPFIYDRLKVYFVSEDIQDSDENNAFSFKAKRTPKKPKKSTKRSKKPKRSPSSRKSPKKTEKGCTRQTTTKYANRPSPPYPANECQGQTFQGNDGEYYNSVMAKNGVYKWVKMK